MDGKIGLNLVLLACVLSLMACAQTNEKTSKETVAIAGMTDDPPPLEQQKAAMVNVELGMGYLSQGQVSRAKSKLTHAVKLAPTIPETHSALAYFQEQVGDNKEAEKEHKKAVKLGEGKGAFFNNYGAFLCRRHRIEEADTLFRRAISDKAYSRTAEVYENAGVCAIKGSNLDAAKDYLTTALKQDPRRTTAILELCDLNLQQGKLRDAKVLLGQYKQYSEPTARSLWLGIQIAHQMQDEDGEASQLLMFKNLFEDSPEYQSYLKSDLGKAS